MYLRTSSDLLGAANFCFLFSGSEVKHDLLVALWDDNLLKPVLKHHMSDMTLTRQL